jgi:ribosomal-protein-alanine N-acetyltransferase
MSAVVQPLSPRIRPMQIADLRRVTQVERAAYEFPWTENIFRDCLRVGYYCCVLDVDGEIIGHGVMSYAIGESHLLNVAVHPDWQGRGYGRMLVLHLLAIARRNGARIVFLEVRLTNRAAYDLYLDLGFSEVGVRKNYYPSHAGREDAMIMALDLTVVDEDGGGI